MEHLTYYQEPPLDNPRMVLGFGGWMDGGHVSTGIVDYLVRALHAEKLGEIDALEFHILNFPVSTVPVTILSDGEKTVVRSISPMEHAAVFRPHTEIRDGIVQKLACRKSEFHFTLDADLVLFSGEEPHFRWRTYADCLFHVVETLRVSELYFVGSVSSPIPHTREPRLRCTFSTEGLRERVQHPAIGLSSYQGPASITTLLLTTAAERGLDMLSLVVEVPHYPFLEIPTYLPSILKATSVLADLLRLRLDLTDLQRLSDGVLHELDALMGKNEDFAQLVHELEEAYEAEEPASDERLLRRLVDQIDLADPDRNQGQSP